MACHSQNISMQYNDHIRLTDRPTQRPNPKLTSGRTAYTVVGTLTEFQTGCEFPAATGGGGGDGGGRANGTPTHPGTGAWRRASRCGTASCGADDGSYPSQTCLLTPDLWNIQLLDILQWQRFTLSLFTACFLQRSRSQTVGLRQTFEFATAFTYSTAWIEEY